MANEKHGLTSMFFYFYCLPYAKFISILRFYVNKQRQILLHSVYVGAYIRHSN